jgi:hypothetical protein
MFGGVQSRASNITNNSMEVFAPQRLKGSVIVPGVDPSSLQRGDVVFFAPVNILVETNDFSMISAAMQTFPYDTPHWWYHVGVAIGGGNIVHYPYRSETNLWDETPGRWPCPVDDALDLTALRLSKEGEGESLALGAEAVADKASGTQYSHRALLAFAAATQARLFRDSGFREELFNFAAGFENVGKGPDGLTCVTMVTTAMEIAKIGPIPIDEPPIPAPSKVRPGWTDLRIDQLYSATTATAQAKGVKPGTRRRYREDQILPFAPGEIATMTDYVNLLVAMIHELVPDYSEDDLLTKGADLRGKKHWPTATSWAISPAMLHDGLLELGATPVV